MEHSDSQNTTDENVAAAAADNSENPSARPSAIERQIAAVTARGYGNDATSRYVLDSNRRRRKPRRFGLVSFLLLLFLLVVGGLVFVFSDLGRPLQSAVSAALQPAQTVAPTKTSDVAKPNAITVPIADVSLRNRPELLEQLVQVYRSQLAVDANDSTALAALNQLRERSVSELETIIAGGDDVISTRSLEMILRVFPELANNARYQNLVARTDSMHRAEKTEPTAKPEQPPASTANATSPTAATAPTSAATTIAAQNSTENALSTKPEIRAVSITRGTMVQDNFVPSDDGNVFMVEISYRNFAKALVDQTEATLEVRLGILGDSMVLAEKSMAISADRGAKSFVMETLTQGFVGGKFQLNFILNDEFLTSRTVRLSMSGQ